jgi:hypothetical protein
MRQVGVALTGCLVASTFAAGQSSNAPGSAKKQEVQFQGGRSPVVRNAEVDRSSTTADSTALGGTSEKPRQSDSRPTTDESGAKLGFASATGPAKYTGGAEHYGDPK